MEAGVFTYWNRREYSMRAELYKRLGDRWNYLKKAGHREINF